MREVISRYSEFVVRHPLMVLFFSLILTAVSFWGAMNVETNEMNYQNMLPQNYTEIQALNFVSDEFSSSTETVSVFIEIGPHYINSSEARDIRNSESLKYMEMLEIRLRKIDGVTQVSGLPDAFRQLNGGSLPKTRAEYLELTESLESQDGAAIQDTSSQMGISSLVSRDYSLAIIKVSVVGLPDDKEAELIAELKRAVEEIDKPAGLKVGITGEIVVSDEVTRLILPTMGQTSSLSMIGILMIVTLLFASLRKGVTSLLAIVFGVVWVYGLIGFFGISLTSATSGSLSMIMGVGVDFGIQIVNRFRQEYAKMKAEKAMEKTLNAVILPMGITTLAALIGFSAMSLGELTLLADLGRIMSYGILTCFLAAIMVIPPILILSEKARAKFIGKD